MVLVTPRLVKPLDPDEVPPLPTMPKKFIGGGEGVGKDSRVGAALWMLPQPSRLRKNLAAADSALRQLRQ